MKNFFICTMLFLLIAACLTGCDNKADTNDTLNIIEKSFATQVIDIYKNPTSYVGKTIKIEGLCEAEEHDGHSHYYVYRNISTYDPYHGHNHTEQLGLAFAFNGNMPKDNDWIEVVGTLRIYVEAGHTYLTLDADSVKVLGNRGAETVRE